MSYQHLIHEKGSNYTWITLNRPKANALSLELMQELHAAVTDAIADADVRVIVITGGEGKFFAAGADIPTLQATRHDPLAKGGLLDVGIETMALIESSPKPVIAAINGVALGGGCELALACHLRIAATEAIFGQPEINLGIIPGWGGTHRLPLLIGASRAADWLLTGRQVSAEEALAAGLVARMVPREQLAAVTMELAATIAAKPPVALRETLAILHERALHPERGVALEAASFKTTAASDDAGEGISAFLEKRTPNFTGR